MHIFVLLSTRQGERGLAFFGDTPYIIYGCGPRDPPTRTQESGTLPSIYPVLPVDVDAVSWLSSHVAIRYSCRLKSSAECVNRMHPTSFSEKIDFPLYITSIACTAGIIYEYELGRSLMVFDHRQSLSIDENFMILEYTSVFPCLDTIHSLLLCFDHSTHE